MSSHAFVAFCTVRLLHRISRSMGKAKLHYPKGGLCQVTHLLPFVLYVYCIGFLGQWEKLNCTGVRLLSHAFVAFCTVRLLHRISRSMGKAKLHWRKAVKTRICCLLYCTFIASDF